MCIADGLYWNLNCRTLLSAWLSRLWRAASSSGASSLRGIRTRCWPRGTSSRAPCSTIHLLCCGKGSLWMLVALLAQVIVTHLASIYDICDVALANVASVNIGSCVTPRYTLLQWMAFGTLVLHLRLRLPSCCRRATTAHPVQRERGRAQKPRR